MAPEAGAMRGIQSIADARCHYSSPEMRVQVKYCVKLTPNADCVDPAGETQEKSQKSTRMALPDRWLGPGLLFQSVGTKNDAGCATTSLSVF